MNKFFLNFYKNKKFSKVHLFIMLLLSVFLQSCYIEEHLRNDLGDDLLEASLDRNSIRFEYNFGKTTIHSPSDGEVGYNLVLMWLSRDLGKEAQYNLGNFNKTKFENSTPLYATQLLDHGPFYNGILNSELQVTGYNKSETKSSFQQHMRYMSGVEFIQKGAKDVGTKTHLYYFEVPFYVTYWANISTYGKIFGGLGPYIAYGIGGKVKSQTSREKAFDKNGEFKPFDAGLTITGGYKIPNSFSFRLVYDIGLTNILRDSRNSSKAKTRNFSLNFGYPINKILTSK